MIVIYVLVAAVVTSVSARLVSDVDLWWRPGGILYLSATAVMLVLSGVLINALPRVVSDLWNWTGPIARAADRLLTAIRTTRAIAVGTTVVVLGVGSYFLIPSPNRLESGPISLMSAEDVSPNDPRRTLFEQWDRIHPDNPVRFIPAQGETDEQNERMVADAKPGGDQRADVYLLDLVWMAEFADNGYIRPLAQESVEAADLDDFVEPVLRTAERDGKLFGLPFNTDVGLIYYRTDVAGTEPPATWDELYGSPAKALAAKAGPDVAANAIQMSGEMATVTMLEAIWAANGKMVDQNGNVSLTTDKSRVRVDDNDRAGLRRLRDALVDPLVTRGDRQATEMTEERAIDDFVNGRALAMRNWAVAYERLNGRKKELAANEITFATVAPAGPSVLGGQNLAIAAHTAKPRAAQALIEFLTSVQSQLILAEIGGFAPTRDSVYGRIDSEHFDQIRAALRDARPRPSDGCYTEFSKRLRASLPRLTSDGDTDDVTRELAEALCSD